MKNYNLVGEKKLNVSGNQTPPEWATSSTGDMVKFLCPPNYIVEVDIIGITLVMNTSGLTPEQ